MTGRPLASAAAPRGCVPRSGHSLFLPGALGRQGAMLAAPACASSSPRPAPPLLTTGRPSMEGVMACVHQGDRRPARPRGWRSEKHDATAASRTLGQTDDDVGPVAEAPGQSCRAGAAVPALDGQSVLPCGCASAPRPEAGEQNTGRGPMTYANLTCIIWRHYNNSDYVRPISSDSVERLRRPLPPQTLKPPSCLSCPRAPPRRARSSRRLSA